MQTFEIFQKNISKIKHLSFLENFKTSCSLPPYYSYDLSRVSSTSHLVRASCPCKVYSWSCPSGISKILLSRAVIRARRFGKSPNVLSGTVRKKRNHTINTIRNRPEITFLIFVYFVPSEGYF